MAKAKLNDERLPSKRPTKCLLRREPYSRCKVCCGISTIKFNEGLAQNTVRLTSTWYSKSQLRAFRTMLSLPSEGSVRRRGMLWCPIERWRNYYPRIGIGQEPPSQFLFRFNNCSLGERDHIPVVYWTSRLASTPATVGFCVFSPWSMLNIVNVVFEGISGRRSFRNAYDTIEFSHTNRNIEKNHAP